MCTVLASMPPNSGARARAAVVPFVLRLLNLFLIFVFLNYWPLCVLLAAISAENHQNWFKVPQKLPASIVERMQDSARYF